MIISVKFFPACLGNFLHYGLTTARPLENKIAYNLFIFFADRWNFLGWPPLIQQTCLVDVGHCKFLKYVFFNNKSKLSFGLHYYVYCNY